MKIDDLVMNYIKVRDLKKEMQDRHKEELAPLNNALDSIEGVLMKFFQDTGQTSAQTTFGTAYTSKRESFTIVDPVMFRGFAAASNDMSFFEARASKERVSAFLAETGELPPGVKYSAEVTIGVRRS